MNSIKTTYENINIGDTIRLFLEISDLIDNSGNPIHLDSIEKVSIEKLNNDHLDPNAKNIVVKSYYGPRFVRITIPGIESTTNFLKLPIVSLTGVRFVRLDVGTHYVKIVSPESVSGIYKIEDVPVDYYDRLNQPVGQTILISGVFGSISNSTYFQILDENYNVLYLYTDTDNPGANLEFNESIDLFSPLWKKDLAFFEDVSNLNDFSSISNISSCRLEISPTSFVPQQTYSSYDCVRITGNGMNAFSIIGFEDNSSPRNDNTYYWRVFDADDNIIFSGSNGRIRSDYFSQVYSEEYINSENVLLNRYYLDWKIEDTFVGGEGSYIVYWHTKRSSCKETFFTKLLIHNDFSNPEITQRKFNRENYSELLRKYIPFFYMDYEADDVLKQTLQAFGESIFDFQFMADQFVQVIDPANTPTRFLPYISNMFSYNLKGDSPVEWRQQLDNLPRLLKKKGTLDALVQALSLMGTDVLSVVFYWQVKSPYLWTDYFYLKNDNSIEELKLSSTPLSQLTGINQVPDFSRYNIEYYSQEQSKWYNLNWTRTDLFGNVLDSQEFNDVLRMQLVEERKKTQRFSKKISWNWQEFKAYNFYITVLSDKTISPTDPIWDNPPWNIEDTKGLWEVNLENDLFINNFSDFRLRIISGKSLHGLFTIKNIFIDDENPHNNSIQVEYTGSSDSIIDEGLSGAPIIFSIFKDGEQNTIDPVYNQYYGLFKAVETSPISIKDSQGKIRGKVLNALDTDYPEFFTPMFNDVIKVRYQYSEYKYENNSSCPSYQIGFDESDICKDDYILSLQIADQRSVYDSEFPDSRILPPVNFNIHLIPDSNCFVKTPEDFCGLQCLQTETGQLRTFDICDICTKRNPLSDPVIFGYIRTKFPWSENVYNMDEYDGSTRPSYIACDIDEDFIDKCGCCWSSFFSMSISVGGLSDKMISSVRELIDEFKPFHSRLLNLSFVGHLEDNIYVDDNTQDLEVRYRHSENLSFGYIPHLKKSNELFYQERSETFFFALDEYYTLSVDMNVYLRDFNVFFDELSIGEKLSNTGPSLPTQVNINSSRVVIESSSGIHANKTYNIEQVFGKRIKLTDATNDNGDIIPSPPYSSDGPWSYTIYTRKFPGTAVLVTDMTPWPQPVNVNITKSGKYAITTSVDILNGGVEVVSVPEDQSNSYSILIESGQAIPGYYSILLTDDQKMIIDYPFSMASVGNITFTIYKDGESIDGFQSISGVLSREDVYGEFTYGTSDLVSDWDIDPSSSYVQVNNGQYYKILSINNNFVKFSGYALGSEGTLPIAIFEKIVTSQSGFIEASTDLIHVNNIDLYNTINYNGEDRVRDFLVGLEINGILRYYHVDEIFSGDVNKIRLKRLRLDEVVTNQNMYLRIHALTDYTTDVIIPGFNQDIVLVGTSSTGTTSSQLVDNSRNFVNLNVSIGDVIYKFDPSINIDYYPIPDIPPDLSGDGWALVSGFSTTINPNDTIIFDSPLRQGSSLISLSPSDSYRIVRRKLYDIRKPEKVTDILKIEFGDMKIPVQNISEISPGEYEITIESQNGDKNQTIEVRKDSKIVYENVLVGPLDNIEPQYIPSDLSSYRIIDKDSDGSGGLVDEFMIPVYDKLIIDYITVSVRVNGVNWKSVERWTDPTSAPGNIGLKEYIVKKITDNEVQIHFGDGITGRKVVPADIIDISYFNSGIVSGPIMPETIGIRTEDNVPDTIEQQESLATGPTDVLTQKEHIFFVIEDIYTLEKRKIFVG